MAAVHRGGVFAYPSAFDLEHTYPYPLDSPLARHSDKSDNELPNDFCEQLTIDARVACNAGLSGAFPVGATESVALQLAEGGGSAGQDVGGHRSVHV